MRENIRFLVFVIGATVGVVWSENQFFRVRPTDQESKEGGEVEFQCHVGNRAGDVQWSKDGFLLGFDPKIPGYPRYFMNVKEEEGVYNLHIKDVNFQDEGEFQCQVGPAVNNTPIRSASQLRILVPPEYITVNGLGQASTVEVRQNTSVRLTCQAVGSKPAAQLQWYRDSVEVPKESVHDEVKVGKSRYTTTSYLTVRPLVSDDGAKFACEAFHKALDHRMRNEVTLSVLHPPSPPQIEGYKEGVVVKAGEALTLVCISQGGNPPPQLIWYRGNAQIDATYYLIKGDTATANNLTFVVSATDNTGAYHCRSSNIATREPLSASIKLSVYYLSNKLWIHGPSEAPRGSTVTLSCQTDVSNPRSELRWTMDGQEIDATQETVREAEDGWVTTSNLTISLSRQEPDAKVFSCYAKNPHVSGTASTAHQLRVVYAPNPPTILGYDAELILRVGDLQKFNCVTSGGNPPAILRWYKGDREISTPVVPSGRGVSSELLVKVQLSDNGAFYRCEANNSALRKPLTAFVRLAVRFPPANVSITVTPTDPRVGDNVTLTCTTSSSNPTSRISWQQDGLVVREHKEETLASEHGGVATRSRISLLATPSDDRSRFTCLARSDESKVPVSDVLVLRIRHAPVFPRIPASFDVTERNSTTINMTAGAYPSRVSYVWVRKGATLVDGVVGRITADGPVLRIRNASRDDDGAYNCVAENDEGQSTVTITLNVLYGASVESVVIVTPSGPLFEGSEATLECKVSARPAPADLIRWRIKGVAKAGRPGRDVTQSVLHITNVSRDLRGPAECWADNGIGGPSVRSVLLNILYKPLIIQSGGELDYSLARIKCVADGIPNVTITWTLNGTLLRSKGDKYSVSFNSHGEVQWTSMLIIKDIGAEDHGIYTCIAKNVLGQDTSDVIINDKGVIPGVSSTAVSPKENTGRLHGFRNWWIPAASCVAAVILLCCLLFACCLRRRSNRTTPERSRETRHIDMSDITDDVCNKILLTGDVKTILYCASEKQHMPLHDYKGHSVFTIEDTYKIDPLGSRQLDSEEKDNESKHIDDNLKETFIEEIHRPLVTTKEDCPDILRNEKCLCLNSSKDACAAGTSPQSDSPESPRYNSTPSGSTGSCLSVYHEKTSIRSLAGDIDSATMVKLHPIMVLRIDEDSYKCTET